MQRSKPCLVRKLLVAGACPDISDRNSGKTALHFAVENCNVEIVTLLGEVDFVKIYMGIRVLLDYMREYYTMCDNESTIWSNYGKYGCMEMRALV